MTGPFSILATLLAVVSAITVCSSSQQTTITVGQSTKFNFTRIQDAIDAVPVNNRGGRVVINVMPGTYREKIFVNKTNISLIGTEASSTVVVWNEPWLQYDSATVTVQAPGFVAKRLTFQNTFGTRRQALALRVAGDRAAFYDCRFVSFQDTILDDSGRHYYRGCYVEGGTDFICGNGKSLFEKCRLHSTSPKDGAFTAQRRNASSEDTGYSFVGCTLTGTGVGTSILGRPWGNYSRVVFALSNISNTIEPRGWDDWQEPENQRTAFYGEFNCYGDGADTSRRVPWSHKMSAAEAALYLTVAWVGGQDWLEGS